MKTIRSAQIDKLTLRLVQKDGTYIGVIFAADGTQKTRIDGDDADDVWRRLHDEAGKANPKYFGFDGALARFLHFFPNGFHSDGYTREERDYKIKAKTKLDSAAPLTSAVNGIGYGEAVLVAFRGTNLLSPFEKVKLQDVLRGPSADPFVQAVARFTLGDTKSALIDMDRILRPHDSAKWTVVTYLPYLWRPEAHMFLKPEVTKDFSARIGHRFSNDYQARLDISVYESLLDLVAFTEEKLRDLEPRDRIDVQSFIWVVVDYNEATEQPKS